MRTLNYTTIKESSELLDLGLDRSTADMCYEYIDECDGNHPYYSEPRCHAPESFNDIPCWSYIALLKSICVDSYEIKITNSGAEITPVFKFDVGTYTLEDAHFKEDTPMHAAYKMVAWVLKNKKASVNINPMPELHIGAPSCLKYIGSFTYEQLKTGDIEKKEGDVVTTDNGTYIYTGHKWELVDIRDVIKLPVEDRGYVRGRGYYTVIDNSENIPIDLNSTIRKGTKSLQINGIEKTIGATGVQSRWALITREETKGDTLTIDLYGNRLIVDLL